VSPLWRRSLRIALAPGSVCAVLMARGRKPAVEKKLAWGCRPGASDTHPWQAAIRALREGIGELQAKGADATIVLSNHFVRYALLPWSDQVTGAEERQAMARIHFERHFGAASSGWTVRLSDDAYGKASLASAVDLSLPEAILQACQGAGLRPASVQPYLMSVFNQYRRQLAAPNTCLVVAEPGKIGLLMAGAGGWFAVRTLPLRHGLSQELEPLVRRELLLAGLPAPARIYLHAPGEAAVAAAMAGGLPLDLLELPPHAGFSPRDDVAYSMAMSGVA
jgi:hypothetical protein